MSLKFKKTFQIMMRTSKRWNLVLNYANISMKYNETVVKGVFGSRRNNELPNTLNMVTYIFCYNDVYKRNITIPTSGDGSGGSMKGELWWLPDLW